MKKIRNYFLALVFLFILTPAIVVRAGDSASVTGSGTASSPYVVSGILDYDGGNTQLDFKKTSDTYTYFKIPISNNIALDFQGTKGVEYKASDGAYHSYTDDFKNGADSSITLPAGATIIFRIPNANISVEDGVGRIYLQAHELSSSPVQSYAELLPMGSLIKKTRSSGNAKFKINADHACYLMIQYFDKTGTVKRLPDDGYFTGEGWTRYFKDNDYVHYENGINTIWIDPTNNDYEFVIPYSSDSSTFSLYTVTKEYDWGSLNFTWSNNYSDFTVTVAPGNNPDGDAPRLSYWRWPYDSSHNYGTLSGTSGTGHIDHTFDSVGYASVEVSLVGHYSRNTVYKTVKPASGTLVVKPKKPTVSLKTVNWKSATLNLTLVNKGEHGDKLLVQQKSGTSWKTIKTVTITSGISQISITGLAAKKSYQMRIFGRVDAKNGYPAINGTAAYFSFKTGLKTKPSVKSVKVSNVKVKKVPKKTIWGHLSGNVWIDTYTTGGYYITSFKVTVTLKKAAKGSKGIWVSGVFMKGTGKKFSGTLKVNAKSSMKGKKKKLSISSAMSKSYGGLSPAVYRTVKIK